MGNCQQALNSSPAEIEINPESEEGIFLAVKIWSKKSNELFNYEAQQYKELKYDLTDLNSLPKQLRHLFQRNPDDGFMVFNPTSAGGMGGETSHGFLSKWVNLRSVSAEDGVQILKNDTFKLGNTIFKVSEVFFSAQNKQQLTSHASTDFASVRGRTLTIDQYQKTTCNSIKNVSPCGSQRGSTIAMQKATTMIGSASHYHRTEEHFEDDNNASDDDDLGSQPDEKDIKLSLDNQSGYNAKRKKHYTHHMVQGGTDSTVKQCRICLETISDSNYDDDENWKHKEDFFDGNTAGQTVEQMLSKIDKEMMMTQSGAANITEADDMRVQRNPMISICSCAGSMKYVHLKCLQMWVKSKQHLTEAFKSKVCEFYSHKALTCELCKKPYPLKISINGELVYLLQNMADDDTSVGETSQNQLQQQSQQLQQQLGAQQANQGQVIGGVPQAGDHDNEDEEEEEQDEDDDAEENEADDEDEEEDDDEDEDDEDNSTICSSERRKFGNFVILEMSNASNPSLNGLVIVNLARQAHGQSTKMLTIGRQNSCDIKINDITMSRFHAELHVDYERFRVFLKDTNSKFGTLLQLRKQLVINKRLSGAQVQINNVCLEFSVAVNPQDDFEAKKKAQLKLAANAQSGHLLNCTSWKNKCKPAQDDEKKDNAEIVIADRSSNSYVHKDRDYYPIAQLQNQNPFQPPVRRQ